MREAGLALGRIRRGDRHVAELATRARFLGVVVEVRAGNREDRVALGHRADAVDHRVRAACARSIRAASPSTARRWFSNWLVSAPSIVQCPLLCTRGAISFGEQAAVEVEQLDAADTDVVERVEQRHDARLGRGLQRAVVPAGRRARDAQDAVAVLVLDDGPAPDLAVAAAHADDRQLTVERDERFEDQWHAAELRPRRVDVGRRAQHRLALAVVAAAARLQHRRADRPRRPRGRDRRASRRDGTRRSGSPGRCRPASRRAGPARPRARAPAGARGRAPRGGGPCPRARLPTRR